MVFPVIDWTNIPNLLPIIIGVVLGLALVAVFWGILTMKQAHRKGYHGYFWTGFFLWMIGLIYVVGLPLSEEMRLDDMKKLVKISVRAGLRQ
jgi:uncharacterized membrane protein